MAIRLQGRERDRNRESEERARRRGDHAQLGAADRRKSWEWRGRAVVSRLVSPKLGERQLLQLSLARRAGSSWPSSAGGNAESSVGEEWENWRQEQKQILVSVSRRIQDRNKQKGKMAHPWVTKLRMRPRPKLKGPLFVLGQRPVLVLLLCDTYAVAVYFPLSLLFIIIHLVNTPSSVRSTFLLVLLTSYASSVLSHS